MPLTFEEELFVAGGIAGYALSIELLIVLSEEEIIDSEAFLAVIDRALALVENLNIDGEHPLSRKARMLLWSLIQD